MTARKSHQSYENQLLEKDIDLMPLEEYKGNNVPILHECIQGHQRKMRPSNILNGAGCFDCKNKKRKKTTAQYEQELFEKQIDCWPLEDYKGCNIKILHTCVNEHTWLARPDSILQYHGCPYCAKLKNYTTDEYNELITPLKAVEEYVNNSTKIQHICPLGHLWKAFPNGILQGKGCPECAKKGGYNAKFFERNPDKANMPGILYCVVLIDKATDERKCLKIGITRGTSYKNVKIRANHFTGYTYAVQKIVKGTLEKVYNLEQELHKKWEHKRYKSEWKFAGYTELFELDEEIIRSIPTSI